jgi:hypothetical protein
MNNPPLRKRSEIGRAKTPATAAQQVLGRAEESFTEFETETAAQIAPAPAEENISEFVTSLEMEGIKVSLIDAAGWGTAKRQAVRDWLKTKDPCVCVPEFLQPYFGKKEETLLSPAPQHNLRAIWQRLFDFGLDITQVQVAAFKPLQLDVIQAWFDQGALGDARPEFLDPYVSALKQSVASPPPKPLAQRMAEGIAQVRAERAAQVETQPVAQTKGLEAPPRERPSEARIPVDRGSVRDITVSESEDYNRLVETILKELDLDREYAELEALLEVGDNRRDYATLNEQVDKADRRALQANALWGNAVIMHEKLKLDQQEVDASLWREATEALEKSAPVEEAEEPELDADGKKRKKAAAPRKKPITNVDVEAKLRELYPDEWREGKLRVKKSELTVERCRQFSERWSNRCRALAGMLAACRK